VGRVDELRAVLAALRQGGRLVTLVGPGGIGKTRLARELVAILETTGGIAEAGVIWADLAEAEGEAGVLDAVGAALSLPDPAAGPGAPSRVAGALAGAGPVLLVLDGADRVVEPLAAAVARWLSHAPEIAVLVTSREKLQLDGEHAIELGPLGLPGREAATAEAPAASEAVQLFLQAASRRAPGWILADADRPFVESIVRLLDGIPLAIELAAPRLEIMGPRALLHRLTNRFDVLAARRRGAPGRHATMRTAVEFSWDVLDEPERRALAWCSVFRGGFTLEAAEAVLGDEGGSETTVVDRIQGLRTRSLLTVAAQESEDGNLRLSMYETIRRFAADRLDDLGERREAEARHSAFFVGWGRQHAPGAANRAAVDAHIRGERHNLLAVAERVLDGGPVSARAAEPALESLLLLEPVLLRRGPLERFAALLDPVLEATARSGADPHLYCRALAARGNLQRERGAGRQGLQDLMHALSIAREIDAPETEDRCLLALGEALAAAGQPEDAAEQFERARSGFARRGDGIGEGVALRGMARLAVGGGRPDDAADLLERALAAHGAPGAEPDRARDLRHLGRLQLDAGRTTRAREALLEARRTSDGIGDVRGLAVSEGLLAQVQHLEGDLPAAREVYLPVIHRLGQLGFRRLEAEVTVYLGLLAWEAGAGVEARALWNRASELLEGDDAPGLIGWIERLIDVLDAGHPGLETAADRAADAASRPLGMALTRRAAREALASAGERRIADLPVQDLAIGDGAEWFRAPGGAAVDLRQRRPLRRMLWSLVEHRRGGEEGSLSVDELLARGWPGERVIPEAGAHRVRVAISTLRKLGLKGVLITGEDGYLLDPSVTLHVME